MIILQVQNLIGLWVYEIISRGISSVYGHSIPTNIIILFDQYNQQHKWMAEVQVIWKLGYWIRFTLQQAIHIIQLVYSEELTYNYCGYTITLHSSAFRDQNVSYTKKPVKFWIYKTT